MNRAIAPDSEINIDVSPSFIILCDMDGTLIDTDYANYLSYKHAFEEVMHQMFEIPFNPGKRFNRDRLNEMAPCLTVHQRKDIIALKSDFYNYYLPETRVNAILANFIMKHSGTNRIVLVTYCREQRVIETLRHHNLLRFFSQLICRETLSESGLLDKYTKSLTLLDADPLVVLVCENEVAEIKKAMRAGVPKSNILNVRFGTKVGR